jgi:hypothetical protein
MKNELCPYFIKKKMNDIAHQLLVRRTHHQQPSFYKNLIIRRLNKAAQLVIN